MGLLDTQEITEQGGDFVARIGEMGGPDMAPDLPVPAHFMNQVRENDDHPVFVTVEVASGQSNNKRIWKPEHVRKVVDKVNKERMGGNLGHPLLDPKAYDSAFPIPQVVWVAAKAVEIGGKTVGKFKGYVLKTAEARELLRLGLIDGVSWFGDMRAKRLPDGTLEVIDFEPETIDFARKGRSGMKSRVLALAGEQTGNEGGSVEPRDISALSIEEVKSHAPLLVKALQDEATAPLTTKIGEQDGVLTAQKPEIDMMGEIRKLLGLQDGDNPVEKLTEFLKNAEEAAKDEIRTFVRSIVGKKVKTKRGQDVVLRLLGGEMEEWESEPLTEDKKKEIEKAVKDAMEEDKAIKALVGEMEAWEEEEPPGDEGDGDGDGEGDGEGNGGDAPARNRSGGGSRLGGRSRVGEQTGRKDTKDTPVGVGAVVKRTGRLTVTRQKFGA